MTFYVFPRGGRGRPADTYRIEGEYVTMREIAERIGETYDATRRRMRTLKKASGPITWERLRAGKAREKCS